MMNRNRIDRPFVRAGIVLGIGLGGFVDGIVLHQILQWHHMLTSAGFPATTVSNMEVNMVADGLFDATTWVITVVGLGLLWRAKKQDELPPARFFVGSIAIGWGLFNLVEGIIDHHILGIHHVRSGPNQIVWDLAFLAFGAVLAVVGWILVRRGRGKMVTE
jgi:uncharacterized membrane protein